MIKEKRYAFKNRNRLQKKKGRRVADTETDFRLYVSDDGRICVSLRDLSDQFDPTAFFDLHRDDEPGAHIGIRMVTKMATDIKYYSAFDSNNLIIYID